MERLLAAQGELGRSLQGFATLSLPFSPVRDGRVIEGNIIERLQAAPAPAWTSWSARHARKWRPSIA